MIQDMIQLLVLLGTLWRISCSPYHFILVQEQKIWEEAQSYCREKHHDLATVQSDEDRSLIREAAEEVNFDSVAWIGLYGGLSAWRWSFHSELVSFEKWESWEPDMSQTQEACAFLSADGRWGDSCCLEEKYFFCYNENSVLQFELISLRLPWRAARHHCRTHGTDLATIPGDVVNTVLTGSLRISGEWGAWIGLFKNGWLWSDRTPVSWVSVSWIDTQPDNGAGNESCAFVRADAGVGDDVCSAPHSFFCRADVTIRKQQRVRLAVRAAEGLEELTVMTAIEEKISQILAERQMDSEFNVTWRVNSDGRIFQPQENIKQESMKLCQD